MKTAKRYVTLAAICIVTGAFADGLSEGYTQLPYLKANKNVQVKTGYMPAATDRPYSRPSAQRTVKPLAIRSFSSICGLSYCAVSKMDAMFIPSIMERV